MQKLLEIGSHNIFVQNSRIEICQMQWTSQIRESPGIWVVLQGEQKIEPTSSQNKEEQTVPLCIQMLQLQGRPPSRFEPMPILEAPLQQRMASEEIC